MDQLSWATGDCTRGLAVLTSISECLGSVSESPRGRPAVSYDLDPGPRARGGDQIPGNLRSGTDSPQARPAVSYDSGTSPRARGVDQVSQVTPAHVLGFAVDQLYRAPWARVRCPARSTSSPGGLGPASECPRGRPAVPCVSGQGPIVRGFDELFRATRGCARGPAVSASSPGRMKLGSEGPRVYHMFLGDTG